MMTLSALRNRDARNCAGGGSEINVPADVYPLVAPGVL